MTDEEILIVMTVCKLLEKSVTRTEIEKACAQAKKELDRSNQPPREAKQTYAHRRYETE